MAVVLESMRRGWGFKIERKMPQDLVAQDARRLWSMIAPERWPTAKDHTAGFPFSDRGIRQAEAATPQVRALQRIVADFVTADGGDGLFAGQLFLHPYFGPEGFPKQPLIGEPSFVLGIAKLTPPQLEFGAREVLRIVEVPDRARFITDDWDEKHGLRRRLVGHYFRPCSQVSVHFPDGPQPYTTSKFEGCPANWGLVGFSEEEDKCLWVDRNDPEYIFRRALSLKGMWEIVVGPDDSWSKLFARRTISALVNILGQMPREKRIEFDQMVQEAMRLESLSSRTISG